jgi:hypothetical protein
MKHKGIRANQYLATSRAFTAAMAAREQLTRELCAKMDERTDAALAAAEERQRAAEAAELLRRAALPEVEAAVVPEVKPRKLRTVPLAETEKRFEKRPDPVDLLLQRNAEKAEAEKQARYGLAHALLLTAQR